MKTYIIDLDGTMYRGNDNIDGAIQFIDELNSRNINYIFLTNNATRTRKDNVKHMETLGFTNIKEESFYTSAIASAKYISSNNIKNVYCIGTKNLEDELINHGCSIVDNNAECVVVGLDREATYKEYSNALHNLLDGASLVGTNKDKRLAHGKTFDIGNGSIVKMLEYASDKNATIVGKPENIILELLIEEYNLNKEDMIIVGDNLETDIKIGIDNNISTIFVTTGVHSRQDLDSTNMKVDMIVDNLMEVFN